MSKESVLDIPFSAGIDQSQRDELLSPVAGFVALENGRQRKAGGYSKRHAFAALSAVRSDATTRTAGLRLLSHNGSACVIDGTQLDARSTTAAADVPRCRVPECTATRKRIGSRQRLLTAFDPFDSASLINDLVYVNGYYVLLYVEMPDALNVELCVDVIDAVTLTVVASSVVNGSTQSNGMVTTAKLVAVGANVVALWDGADQHIYGSRMSMASVATMGTWAAPVSLAADLSGGLQQFDAYALTTKVVLAYLNTNNATHRITVKLFDPTTNALTVGTTATPLTPNAVCRMVSCAGAESDIIWLAYGVPSTASVLVEGLDPASLAVTATSGLVFAPNSTDAIIKTAVAYTGVGTGHVVAAAKNVGANVDWYTSYGCAFAAVAGAVVPTPLTGTVTHGVYPISRPFKQGARTYVEYLTSSTVLATTILCDITSNTVSTRPVAMAAPRLMTANEPQFGGIRNSVRVSSTKWATVACIAASAVSASLCAIEYDFAANDRWQPQSAASGLLLSGGVPVVFDGDTCAELAFVIAPEVKFVSGGGIGITGTFEYSAIYEATDDAGNVIWSEPAPVISTGAIANKTINLNVRPLSITWHDGSDAAPLSPKQLRRVRIKLYRTVNGGGIFYLVGEALNDPQATAVAFADNTTDAVLVSHPELYRSPGVQGTPQPRQSPGCVHAWCEYNGMIVAVGDDQQTLWWTPQHVSGEGIYFTDNFQQPLDQDGPTMTVFAQDGTLFACKRRAIYAMSGEAASDNGAQGGLGTPRKLACDIGSIGPLTAVTALGTFFISERGIELLTRGQSIADPPPGLLVQDIFDAFPVCTAITVDSAEGLVYFEMAEGMTDGVVTGNGRTLVFDIRLKAWISFDRRTNTAGTADVPARSATLIYNGGAWRYAWLAPNGVVHVEDQTTHLDPGAHWVRLYAETSWIHAAGIQGEQSVDRIMLLAAKATAHDLTMTVYFDYVGDSGADSKTFTAAQIAALGRQWIDRELSRSTNTAIKVILNDATPSSGVVGTGEGATWIGLAFPGIPHRGVKRTSAAQRGG